MTTTPRQPLFCAHADTNGDPGRCACGFDSIPSDLNVYQLYRRSVEDGTGELCDTDLV
ncbi:hypothetical protein GR254_12680, partial [Mycobacterium tuberculosis]|nr:hypothetical protein [Mycobacterium tuberculosis]